VFLNKGKNEMKRNSVAAIMIVVSPIGAVIASSSALAQGGPITTQGSINGVLDEQQMDWRLIMRDAAAPVDQIGASLQLEDDSAGRFAALRLNAIPRNGMAPAGMLRGNRFLRVELFYDLPPDAGPADLADLVGLQPLEAGVSFIETWPGNVERPALQFSSMFMPVRVRLSTLSIDGGAGNLVGDMEGRLCLFAYHVDQRGDTIVSEAEVLGTQPCVDFQLAFDTDFILLD
jgi:hypothetical protein